jgi:hypothetical protein
VPPSNVLSAAQPASRNTFSIRELFGSVSAEKTPIPFARATTARCSSSKVAIPPLFVVPYSERDLGFVRRNAVVAGDRDEAVPQLGHEYDVVAPVDVGDSLELRGGRRAPARRSADTDSSLSASYRSTSARSSVGAIGRRWTVPVGKDDVAVHVGFSAMPDRMYVMPSFAASIPSGPPGCQPSAAA